MLDSIKEKINNEAKKKVFGQETMDSELDQGWMEMTKNSLIEKALTLVGLKSLAEARKAKRLKTTSKETKKTDDKTDEKGEKTPLYSGAENQTEINKEGLTEEQIKLIDQLQSAKKTANLTVKMAKFADPTEAMASLFPGLGDGGASVSLGVFYHSLGMSVGFNKKQHASITRILAKDFAAGLIPVVGDIADFVYKGCKKIGRIFDKHFKTLSTDSEGKLPADILEKIKNDKTIDKKLLAKVKEGKREDAAKETKKQASGKDRAIFDPKI